ncbi:MAG: RNA chaperone Hfq [Nitrospirota bacterium]|nr:RNA chaperone Hfq [Nitrospirota bacterium]
MSKGQGNIQNLILNLLRKEKMAATIYLVNGAKIRGTIKGFDNFVLLVKGDSPQMVYKHAVSTIIPESPLEGLDNLLAAEGE